jgi:hypothetical protein
VQAGRSNTLVAPLATHRAVAWRQTAERAPWSGDKTTVTGTPVRELTVDRATARTARGLTASDQLLLVFGGSQRVRRFETALDGALAALLTEWRVLHVVMDGLPEAERRRASLPAELRDRYEPVAFLGGGAMEAALVSADLMLGVPFNIARYALLLMMVGQVAGLKPYEFVHTFGDVHIYSNHVTGALEQLKREPRPLPTMTLNPAVTDLFAFKYEDFTLSNYNPHDPIKFEIAV